MTAPIPASQAPNALRRGHRTLCLALGFGFGGSLLIVLGGIQALAGPCVVTLPEPGSLRGRARVLRSQETETMDDRAALPDDPYAPPSESVPYNASSPLPPASPATTLLQLPVTCPGMDLISQGAQLLVLALIFVNCSLCAYRRAAAET
jgi:hypothetical protein